MTLFNVKSQKYEEKVPYADDFEKNRKRLTEKQIKAIERYITKLVDEEMHKPKNRFLMLAKITGKHWGGSPFQAIYDELDCNPLQAAQLAGSFLIEILMHREERWCFIPAEKDGNEYIARRYFMSEA